MHPAGHILEHAPQPVQRIFSQIDVFITLIPDSIPVSISVSTPDPGLSSSSASEQGQQESALHEQKDGRDQTADQIRPR